MLEMVNEATHTGNEVTHTHAKATHTHTLEMMKGLNRLHIHTLGEGLGRRMVKVWDTHTHKARDGEGLGMGMRW